MPFIANNGQMDEQVAFLCKDLRRHGVRDEGGRDRVCPAGRPGGRGPRRGVFVSGCIGRRMGAAEQEEQRSRAVRVAWASPVRPCGRRILWRMDVHLSRATMPIAPGTCSYKRALGRIPTGLQETTPGASLRHATHDQSGASPSKSNPQSKPKITRRRGVALKEHLVGGQIVGITGEQPAVTTVNYFTGNDKSKWKTYVPIL